MAVYTVIIASGKISNKVHVVADSIQEVLDKLKTEYPDKDRYKLSMEDVMSITKLEGIDKTL